MRVRGFHPFAPVAPDTDDDSPWQDWIVTDGVFDSETNSFKRESPPVAPGSNNVPSQQPPQPQTGAGGASSGGRGLALNADVISEILAATRASPSWKACEIEGTSWTGTAEENMYRKMFCDARVLVSVGNDFALVVASHLGGECLDYQRIDTR